MEKKHLQEVIQKILFLNIDIMAVLQILKIY